MKFLSAMAVGLMLAGPLSAQGRDEICKMLSNDRVEQRSASTTFTRDYRLYNVYSFYNEELDACIHVEEKLIGAHVVVEDLTQSVIKSHVFDQTRNLPLLLCDEFGVDEAIINVVRRNGGIVGDLPYNEWLTDGQGGLPRALKTPDQPFDRVACENALSRWLALWGP